MNALWRKYKLLIILGAVGIAAYLWYQSQQNASQVLADAPAQPSGPVGTVIATGQPVVGNPVPVPGRITPIVPYNEFNGQFPKVGSYTWMGIAYNVQPDTHGFVWGSPVRGGQQVLLYGPASSY